MKNPETTLNISSKNIHSCEDVAKFLQTSGIECNITTNHSVVKCDDKYTTEKGCNIKVLGVNYSNIKQEVWKPLQKEFGLNCARVKMKGQYEGCVLNLL